MLRKTQSQLYQIGLHDAISAHRQEREQQQEHPLTLTILWLLSLTLGLRLIEGWFFS